LHRPVPAVGVDHWAEPRAVVAARPVTGCGVSHRRKCHD
jgi:hypothetical protein